MVTFYSTGCPRCSVLKKKLEDKNIEFETVTDVDKMLEIGIKSAPALSFGGEIMNFSDAIKWVSSI